MENITQLLERNNSLMYYFHEITLGKYDDGELSNFFIRSNDPNNEEYFILSESNDEEAMVNFVKDCLMPTELSKQQLSEKNISYDINNFTILVLQITRVDKVLEIKTLGILEWLLSKVLYDKNTTDFNSAISTLTSKTFNLYATNVEDIKNNFKDIIDNENFKDIIKTEVF